MDDGGANGPELEVDSEDTEGRGEPDRAGDESDNLDRLPRVESAGLAKVTTLKPRPV